MLRLAVDPPADMDTFVGRWQGAGAEQEQEQGRLLRAAPKVPAVLLWREVQRRVVQLVESVGPRLPCTVQALLWYQEVCEGAGATSTQPWDTLFLQAGEKGGVTRAGERILGAQQQLVEEFVGECTTGDAERLANSRKFAREERCRFRSWQRTLMLGPCLLLADDVDVACLFHELMQGQVAMQGQ